MTKGLRIPAIAGSDESSFHLDVLEAADDAMLLPIPTSSMVQAAQGEATRALWGSLGEDIRSDSPNFRPATPLLEISAPRSSWGQLARLVGGVA